MPFAKVLYSAVSDFQMYFITNSSLLVEYLDIYKSIYACHAKYFLLDFCTKHFLLVKNVLKECNQIFILESVRALYLVMEWVLKFLCF